jgi:signal transduction histidine kinase
LLWNRKLDVFEGTSPNETQMRPLRLGSNDVPTPQARFLLADDSLIEIPTGSGEGTLVPLLARSGLIGMLVLGERPGRGKRPFNKGETRALTLLAKRTALSIENQLYQRELIASERLSALGTMAGMLAHDFRGPMTIIRGYAETLLDPEPSRDEVRTRAELIVRTIDRLERMTTETLDFARGGAVLARRAHNLAAFVESLAESIEQEVAGLQVVRRIDVPHDLSISVDTDKVQRAALNIAANALDAMGGTGRLHFCARYDAAAVMLTLIMADEGPGIHPSVRERLFDPFVTYGKKGGTGLGLAVARRFIEDHQGKIDVVSAQDVPGLESVGGACIRMRLPLRAAEGQAESTNGA